MSGLISSIGKIFKEIISSPIFKVVLVAAAIYFTGGLALGAEAGAFAATDLTVAGDAFMPGALASVGVDGASVAPLLTEAGATSADISAITGEGSQLAADAGAAPGVVDSALGSAAGGPGSELNAIGSASDTSTDLASGMTQEQLTGAQGPDVTAANTANTGATPQPSTDLSAQTPAYEGADVPASPGAVTGLPDASQAAAAPGSDPTAGINNGNAFGLPSATTQAAVQPSLFTQLQQGASGALDWAKANPVAAQIIGKGIGGIGTGIGNYMTQQANFAQRDKEAAAVRASQFQHAQQPTMTMTPGKYNSVKGIINAGVGG